MQTVEIHTSSEYAGCQNTHQGIDPGGNLADPHPEIILMRIIHNSMLSTSHLLSVKMSLVYALGRNPVFGKGSTTRPLA